MIKQGKVRYNYNLPEEKASVSDRFDRTLKVIMYESIDDVLPLLAP